MATEIITKITDDLDGSDGASTIEFAFDGASYTVDLSEENFEKLAQALAPYIEVASVVSKKRAKRGVPAYDSNAVRAWASANGIEVSGRGRIKKEVVEAYFAAAR